MAKKKNRTLHPDEPLLHPDHPRPVTRREFIQQGFIAGGSAVVAPTMLGLLAGSTPAHAALSGDMETLKTACGIKDGAGKIPFICFDLAGGANFAGSNVLVGGQGGIETPLTTAGYNKLGIRDDEVPSFGGTELFVDRSFGLPFHSTSSMLAGMKQCYPGGAVTPDVVNGAVIPARSGNDTANNPHNPMYGIHKAGAAGDIMKLIGSRNSDSGGNSMSPVSMIDLTARPTKIDRQSDVSGLVDTGQLANNMGQANATRVMEAIQRISDAKLSNTKVDTGLDENLAIKEKVKCSYVQSARMVDLYGGGDTLDVDADTKVTAAFGATDYTSNGEFRKTASVMKMVVNGLAGAGTITMGGYDYHTGNRTTGDARDVRAGICIGACLRYAELVGKPLMIYVFSDGSLASNGAIDPDNDRLVWTGDNSSTACGFFLVFNPAANGGAPTLVGVDDTEKMKHQQLGWFRTDASVETNNSTPMANNVNSLVESVILNYMALHGEEGKFETKFSNHGLGGSAQRDSVTAFQKLGGITTDVNGDAVIPPAAPI